MLTGGEVVLDDFVGTEKDKPVNHPNSQRDRSEHREARLWTMRHANIIGLCSDNRGLAVTASADLNASGPLRRPLLVRPLRLGLAYGVRLGAAGATAAAIGFLHDLEHAGWAFAAALLVMRPTAEMMRLRSVGRILAVAVGALAGIALVRTAPPAIVYSLAAIATVAGAGGTHGSHSYVT